MSDQYTSFPWSIVLASRWVAESRIDNDLAEGDVYVAITPEHNDALLRLTTFDPEERGVSADNWVEIVAEINRKKARPVTSLLCGDFTGCTLEFATSDEWCRGWALRAGSFPLDVTYRCHLNNAGRDDVPVDTMLKSLRLDKQYAA